jgi:hypothetical protein
MALTVSLCFALLCVVGGCSKAQGGLFSSEVTLSDDSISRFLTSLPRLKAISVATNGDAPDQQPSNPSQQDPPPPKTLGQITPFSDYVAAQKAAGSKSQMNAEVAKDGWTSVESWATTGDRIAATMLVIQRDQQTVTLRSRQSELEQKAQHGAVLTKAETTELGAIKTLLANLPAWSATTSDIKAVTAKYPELGKALNMPAHK